MTLPELTFHHVPLANLPGTLRGFRVVQLTDLHLGTMYRPEHLAEALRMAAACRPDLVVLTGDYTQQGAIAGLSAAAASITALAAPFGAVASLGNHDHWEDAAEVSAVLERHGIPVLVNDAREITEGLWVAGLDDMMAGRPDVAGTTAAIPPNVAVVCLCHNPAMLPELADLPWLVLAGHTHGGQWVLPGSDSRGSARCPLWRWTVALPESLGCLHRRGRLAAVSTHRYPNGWYTAGRARLYVSRGLGLADGFPWRIGCPPEIACFTLLDA